MCSRQQHTRVYVKTITSAAVMRSKKDALLLLLACICAMLAFQVSPSQLMGDSFCAKTSHIHVVPRQILYAVVCLPILHRTLIAPSKDRQSMASGRDRVQVLAGHFASSSTEGQTLDIQAQCTRAAAPMLAGQVRKCNASADCERSVQTSRACRSRSLLVQARVWELQQPSSLLSMAPKWWSQTSIVTSLNRYCITQLYICLFGPQCNMGHCLQVASEIREAGGEAMSVPGDVTAEGFAAKIVKATIDKYGALHILVNNAGQQSLVLMQNWTDSRTMLHICRRKEVPLDSTQLCQLCIAIAGLPKPCLSLVSQRL